jgi:hypothetical protein
MHETTNPSYGTIPNKQLREIMAKSIKQWHFERSKEGQGVVPVEGKFDKDNPLHINQNKIIKLW